MAARRTVTLRPNWMLEYGFSPFASVAERDVITRVLCAWLDGAKSVHLLAPDHPELRMVIEWPTPPEPPPDIANTVWNDEVLSRTRGECARATFYRAPEWPYPEIQLFTGLVKEIRDDPAFAVAPIESTTS